MNTLTLPEIRSRAPSIFAREKAPTTSGRYSFLPTEDVLNALADEGWGVLKAQQSRSRDKSPYVKHSLSLVHSDQVNFVRGAEIPTLRLTNSHDGGCQFRLQAGVEVVLCSNGLTVPGSVVKGYSIRHTNSTIEQVMLAAFALNMESDRVMENICRFKERDLTNAEQVEFARSARAIRFGEEFEGFLPATDLLAPRRREDSGPDLWSVFNRVQENLIRGGFTVGRFNLDGKVVERRAKGIKSIDEDTRINTQLWEAAEGLVLPS